MFTFSVLLFVVALVLYYVLVGRDRLKVKFPALFAKLEPVERWLWNKSETIAWSRFLMLGGLLPVILDQAHLLNIPEVIAVIPPEYQKYLPLIVTLMGVVSEVLRRETTKPLEVVALPDMVDPEVAFAVQNAEKAKLQAVEAVRAHT